MGSKAKAKPNEGGKDVLGVTLKAGKSEAQALTDVTLDPAAHAMSIARPFNQGVFGKTGVSETFNSVQEHTNAAKAGDLGHYRAMLAGQAISLNSIFTEMSRRSALNMGEYMDAAERYMRLALKAQAQSRATIEALERITNGREQTVRHVHVDNRGGQAVIADTINTGGSGNGKSDVQSYATGAAGSGPAMLGADPCGNGVPIPGSEGAEAVQDARRHKSGRT